MKSGEEGGGIGCLNWTQGSNLEDGRIGEIMMLGLWLVSSMIMIDGGAMIMIHAGAMIRIDAGSMIMID